MSNSNFNTTRCVMIISGPSGSGKSTLCQKIVENDPSISISISYTTRSKKSQEIDGQNYHFVSREEFERLIQENQMMEYTQIYDNYYGTPIQTIEANIKLNKDTVLDIETKGANLIQSKIPVESFSVFVMPKSMEILEERLRNRQRDSEEEITQRLENASREIAQAKNYDYIVINDDIDQAVENMIAILKAERLRSIRHQYKMIG